MQHGKYSVIYNYNPTNILELYLYKLKQPRTIVFYYLAGTINPTFRFTHENIPHFLNVDKILLT